MLTQAQGLAQKDPKRPFQANLRRAVSSGYYALFHLLIHSSTREIVGTNPQVDGVRNALARAYLHSDMIEASKKFAQGWSKLPDVVRAGLPTGVVHPDVVLVSQAFVDLQEARHAADYDLSASFLRQDVLALLKQAERAFRAWDRVKKKDPSARMYSLCLLFGKRLSR